jgi:hypothetical protein
MTAFDEQSFIAARLVDLALRVRANDAEAGEELTDLLAAIATPGVVSAPVNTDNVTMLFETARDLAASALTDQPSNSPQLSQPKLVRKGPRDAVKETPASTRPRAAETSVHAAKEAELHLIGATVSELRQRADHLRLHVKASDAAVHDASSKFAKVVQDVADTNKTLLKGSGRLGGGGFVARQLHRVPIIGPAVLAPLAAFIVSALWLLVVILATGATIAAMLVVPKTRYVYLRDAP